MRPTFAIAVLFLCSFVHAAEPTALRDARADYMRDVGNIQLDAVKAKEAATKRYVKTLEEIKKLRTQLGDLEGAIAVRDEIEKMKAAAPVAAEPKALNLDGEWHFRFHPGYPPRGNYTIKGNRVAYRGLRDKPDDEITYGQWKMVDGLIHVHFDTKPKLRPETWAIGSDGRLYVLFYAPEDSLEVPAGYGVGARVKP